MLHKFALLSICFVGIFGITCPSGSIQITNENKCLIQSTDYQDANQAVLFCQSQGGIFAKIENAFENSFAWSLIRNLSPFFIGVKQQTGGVWTNWDGSPLAYTNWAPGEPNNIVGCAAIDPATGTWKAANCFFRQSYFCTIS